MKGFAIILLGFLFAWSAGAQETDISLTTASGVIRGTITIPPGAKGRIPLVLIIAGSGRTDRNGNQPKINTDAYKLLAEALSRNGIACVRYDKRGIGESGNDNIKMERLRFENYVSDAKDWIKFLGSDKRFSGIFIAGHSEGSLIGILAAKDNKQVSGFISLSGAGKAADVIIKSQLGEQSQEMRDYIFPRLDSLKRGDSVRSLKPEYFGLLHPSIQPYIRSWFKYDPKTEIGKLKIPILILQGDKDVQVSVEDAKLLGQGNSRAQVKILPKMSHVLKDAPSDSKEEQLNTLYNDPTIPLNTQLTPVIVDFVKRVVK